MNELITKLSPLFVILILGYVLKKLKILNTDHADIFLKVAVYISLPAIMIPAFAKLPLSLDLFYLPLISMCIVLITLGISYLAAKHFSLPLKTQGTFLLASCIMNIAFVMTFFIAIFGEQSITYLLLFVFGQELLLFTLLYYLACICGATKHKFSHKEAVKKILCLPPLWAFMIGLLLNATNTAFPDFLKPTFSLLGNMFTPLLLIALGTFFTLPTKNLRLVLIPLLIRFVGGFFLAFMSVKLLDIQGIFKIAILAGGTAPIGLNVLVFASLENLDKKLAAQLVSVGLIIGSIVTPMVIWLMKG